MRGDDGALKRPCGLPRPFSRHGQAAQQVQRADEVHSHYPPVALEDLCKVGDGAAERTVAKDVSLASSIRIKFAFTVRILSDVFNQVTS